MIEVTVRQQHAGEAFESCAGLQDLALRSFAAIDKETVFIVRHDLTGQAAIRGRR